MPLPGHNLQVTGADEAAEVDVAVTRFIGVGRQDGGETVGVQEGRPRRSVASGRVIDGDGFHPRIVTIALDGHSGYIVAFQEVDDDILQPRVLRRFPCQRVIQPDVDHTLIIYKSNIIN